MALGLCTRIPQLQDGSLPFDVYWFWVHLVEQGSLTGPKTEHSLAVAQPRQLGFGTEVKVRVCKCVPCLEQSTWTPGTLQAGFKGQESCGVPLELGVPICLDVGSC